MQADEISRLESQHNWREEDFDYVLQFLRTVLMKREYTVLNNCFSYIDRNYQTAHRLSTPQTRSLIPFRS